MDFKKFLDALNSKKVQDSVEAQTSDFSPEAFSRGQRVIDKPAEMLRAGIQGATENGVVGAKDAVVAQLDPNAPEAPTWNGILKNQGVSDIASSAIGATLGVLEPSIGSKAKMGSAAMKAVQNVEKKAPEFVVDRLKILYNNNKAKWDKAAENSPGLKATLDKIKGVKPKENFGKVINMAKEGPEQIGKVILKQPEIQKNFGKTIVKQQADGNILILDENGNVLKTLTGATTIGSK